MFNKTTILWRIYLISIILLIFSSTIIYKVIDIKFFEKKIWQEQLKERTIKKVCIEAVRGSICSDDGRFLATSVPYFKVALDLSVQPLDTVFDKYVDSLAYCLANLFKDKTKSQYKQQLIKKRKERCRYYVLKDDVTYAQLKKLKNFPILKKGRYKGGLIYETNYKRLYPFAPLAGRVIGYDIVGDEKRGNQPVGLEGAYSGELRGTNGIALVRQVKVGYFKPVGEKNLVDPKDGNNIITTINVNIQDVAENALLNQLKKTNADGGCVVVMEVKTGEIKAMANLQRCDDSNYYETYNWAIRESTEPGSIFKLASFVTAMDDGYLTLNDSIYIENGITYCNHTIHDVHGTKGMVTAKWAFEHSSNVAVSKFIHQYYAKNTKQFVEGLYDLCLDKKVGIELPGEASPFIRRADDKRWSCTTLPVMSYGYELKITPLQILTFYNAIANDGYWVKPMIVKEIRYRGNIIKKFFPEISETPICSKKTVEMAKEMMEGVVERGTAKGIFNPNYKIAGKTGTARNQQASHKSINEGRQYQASFVGYFPADNPMYSCIVVIYSPVTRGDFFGGTFSAPVFKEIADKIYSTNVKLQKEIKYNNHNDAPALKSGYKQDLMNVLETLEITNIPALPNSDWIISGSNNSTIILNNYEYSANKCIPNVIGMGLQDAIYLLESEDLKLNVIVKGKGTIIKQSIPAGTKVLKGSKIYIELG